jgi:hypothetical protein
MKKATLIFSLIALAVADPGHLLRAQSLTSDSVSMTPGYAKEIYYSMSQGIRNEVPRNTWDIAFRTMIQTASVITNDGSGVVLYTYPNADTSGWTTVDTAGITGWKPLYNDPDNWDNGAFNRYSHGEFDYGWGIYNLSTHNLTGDSLYVIQLADGTFKKLWIRKKESAANIYSFRYANLDGTNEQNQSLGLSGHLDVDFMGFSLSGDSAVNYQYPKTGWDILFTKYMSVQNDGTPYPVTGVLSNPNTGVKRFAGVPVTYNEFWQGTWDSTRSAIGWDWKAFHMESGFYKVVDSLVFFVLDQNAGIYKLVFTGFAGGTTGNINFDLGRVSSLGVGNEGKTMSAKIYPNPASDRTRVYYTTGTDGRVLIQVTDLTGRTVLQQVAEALGSELNETTLELLGLKPGVYMVMITTGTKKSVQKLIVNN